MIFKITCLTFLGLFVLTCPISASNKFMSENEGEFNNNFFQKIKFEKLQENGIEAEEEKENRCPNSMLFQEEKKNNQSISRTRSFCFNREEDQQEFGFNQKIFIRNVYEIIPKEDFSQETRDKIEKDRTNRRTGILLKETQN